MANALVGRVDGVIGDGIEAAVKLKHRRRLDRLGWKQVFRPSSSGVFADGEPAPRAECSLEVLIDGANAFPLMAEAISAANSFVHITGWHVAPAFELVPGRPHGAIGVLLAEMAQDVDVRVLVWSGSPVPAFHPTRGEVAQALENLTHRTRIQAHGDPREHPLHCHHEKTIVIDGQVAFVGGMDLTDSAGDRYDSQAHQARRRLGWHDVATRLHGPVVADVNDHFRLRWRELTGEDLSAVDPPPPAATRTPCSTTPRCASSPTMPNSPATPGCGCGPSISKATKRICGTHRRRRSLTSAGARSPTSSWSAPGLERLRPTGCWSCPGPRAGRPGCWGHCPG